MAAERAKPKLAHFDFILACLAERAHPIGTMLGILNSALSAEMLDERFIKMRNSHDSGPKGSLNRRTFLGVSGLGVAGAVAVGTITGGLSAQAAADRTTQAHVSGRRKLGSLEVSSVGLGVQNMSRKYDTTVPYRSQMINIIRAAYDHGVTFFDTAEAYGPLECERILGESIQPFRNKVVITSKFGWNIDPETGRFQMGLNSKPDHIKKAVDGMLKRT